jgi:5-methylcytosine-specific restriction endonuclease McrA
LDWGFLYNEFKGVEFDSAKLEKEIKNLMQDEDVTKKSGIYQYLLTRKEKYLNIRTFTPQQKREAFERQNGICPVTKKQYEISEMEADHIKPWHEGGKTTAENCQMLSKEANRLKGGR